MWQFCSTALVAGLTVLAVPTTNHATTVVGKPFAPGGFGYTSHEGIQQMFENFDLSTGAQINQIIWYGQFSDGLQANGQSAANFNIFIFKADPLATVSTPEGT